MQVKISHHTENFELDDNSSLAKWSSLDLLAEEEDAKSPTGPSPSKQGERCILFCHYMNFQRQPLDTLLDLRNFRQKQARSANAEFFC